MRYAKKAMIVAPQPEPTEAGADVLREGGNAVDAGIACALVQGVVDPLMCGIAGFGSCGIYMPGKKFHGYIDAHAPAPLGARPDMWANLIESEARDGYGFILKGRVNDIGYKSICAPANLKMYYEAHKEHGSLPWSRIVEPAIAWAESGWTVRPHVHYWWSDDGAFGRAPNHERTSFTDAARALYCRPDGTPKRVGDRVVNRDYGQTLRAIAKGGADVFYSGEIARAIAEDMKKNEALLSIEDLKAWKPVRNPPLWGDYRGYKVSTNQPPGGGVMLLEMLNILENFDLSGMEHNSTEYVRIVSEAMKRATIDKDAHVGDPKFVTVPVDQLTSKAYAKQMAGEIVRGVKAEVPRFNSGAVSKDTTHISVLDKDGNCFSMTHSLGMPSGVVTPGLGFMYNGCMGVFDPRPGPGGLDRARQGALQLGRALDHLQGRKTAPHHRRARRHADRHGRAARRAERARLRHDHGRGGERAALLGHLRHDRHLQPHPVEGRARTARRRATPWCAAPTLSASPPSTASASTKTASMAAPTRDTTAW